jgi:hypothetical protein
MLGSRRIKVKQGELRILRRAECRWGLELRDVGTSPRCEPYRRVKRCREVHCVYFRFTTVAHAEMPLHVNNKSYAKNILFWTHAGQPRSLHLSVPQSRDPRLGGKCAVFNVPSNLLTRACQRP